VSHRTGADQRAGRLRAVRLAANPSQNRKAGLAPAEGVGRSWGDDRRGSGSARPGATEAVTLSSALLRRIVPFQASKPLTERGLISTWRRFASGF
jgi:hypothetical protein